MKPEESREHYLDLLFSLDEVAYLKAIGLAQRYAAGEIDIDGIYRELKDQGI